MLAWLSMLAFAGDAIPEAEVLRAQIDRNVAGLTLPDAPPIYHLRYQVLTLGQVDVLASLGSLVSAHADPYRALGVEVRVGTPEFDNTGFGGWQNGFGRAGLPRESTLEALALEAWRQTDSAYKDAVEQYARKAAQFTPPPDWPGDYTLTGPVTADLGAATADPDPERLKALAVRLSGAMVGEPALLRGEVYVGHEAGALLTVDTEGSEVRAPIQETTIRAVAQLRTDDGMLLTDQRLWTVRSPDDLPPADQMEASVRQMRDQLVAAAAAPMLDDEYVGPVIFEDEAALALFRYLLITQLEGTPSEIPFDSWFGELGDSKDPVRVGRRVLPPGWEVDDDPTREPAHPGSYVYDQEGTPAQAVDLVEDGIVRTLLMSRVPRRGLVGTNGHARGFVGSRAQGRVSLLEVEPDRTRSRSALYRSAKKLAKAYGRDWVLVVRRLQEPCVLGLGGPGWYDDQEGGPALPPPVQLVRRYADGREEPLRGAAFAGVQRFVLRDVVAAGPMREASFMAPMSGGYGTLSPTEGVASLLAAPEVLIGEMELVPMPGDPREVAVLPPPAR